MNFQEITDGVGSKIGVDVVDTDKKLQRITIGDPNSSSGVAPVDGTQGLKVYTGSSQVTLDASGSNISQETGGNLATIATQITSLNGKATAINTGAVSVASSALPSGASTAANQTTIIGHVDGIETLLGTIDADTSTLAGAVAGSEMQVDVVSSALPTGAATAANQTTIIGHVDGIEGLLTTIDADTSSLAGTVSGSEIQADIVAALPAGTNNIGDVDVLSITNSSLNGPGAPVIDSYTSAAISAAANTANQSLVAAPGANKQIWVYGIQFSAGTGNGSYSIQDEDDTAITGVVPVAQYSGLVETPKGNFAMPLWKVATNKALEVDTVTCDIKGSIQYAIVSV